MTSPSATNSLPLKNGGLKDLPFWYGATWLVRVILVPKVPFIHVFSWEFYGYRNNVTPPLFGLETGRWGQEDL